MNDPQTPQEGMVSSVFGDEGIEKTYLVNPTRQDIKQKPHSQLTYKGNPNNLDTYVRNILEDLNYKVVNHRLNTKSGGFGEQVLDVDIGATGIKLVRMRGKISDGKKPHFLAFSGLGLLLLILNVAVLGIILLIAGAALYYLTPRIRKYQYTPGFITMWLSGAGTAYLGTKARKTRERGERSGEGEHVIQTAYLEGDLDLIVGYEDETVSKNYSKYLLGENEKPDYSIPDLLAAILKQKKELVIGDKGRYEKLPEGKAALGNIADEDLREIRAKLMKFTGF
jgi:hypothetical protein